MRHSFPYAEPRSNSFANYMVSSQQLLVHMTALLSRGLSSQMSNWTEMPDHLSHSCLASQGSLSFSD